MREALESERAMREAAEGLARWHDDERQRAVGLLQEVYTRIKRACGPDSALLPMAMQEPREHSIVGRYPLRRDLDGFPKPSNAGFDFSMEPIRMTELLHLVLHVERNLDQFADLIRFENISERQGGWSTRGYAVSLSAMKRIGMASDVWWLAQQVAHGLTELERRT
ncbi:hypothetical protein [Pelagibacterium montanilacus]|uniref:hypothetical protein n=1 Tax=Pelagibacterium montanilacus TaxID=2185280 RepID=UPI000F8C44CE|nr:hypothetical protein [Pelagibacterium montanilacus]